MVIFATNLVSIYKYSHLYEIRSQWEHEKQMRDVFASLRKLKVNINQHFFLKLYSQVFILLCCPVISELLMLFGVFTD